MGKRKKTSSSKTTPTEEPGGGFGGLAAALAAGGLSASPGTASSPEPASPPAAPKTAASPPEEGLSGKVVVRKERKGHGGKTVTVVEGAALAALSDLGALAKQLRKALGAGARVDGGTVVVQGDQRESAARWLEGRGATVVLGN